MRAEQSAFQFLPYEAKDILREVQRVSFPGLARHVAVEWVSGTSPVACISAPPKFRFARIYLNRALDRPDLPAWVLACVLKHELLHIEVPAQGHGRRRISHPPEFWEREAELCPERDECAGWLATNVGHCLYTFGQREGVWVCPGRISRRQVRRAPWSIWPPQSPNRRRAFDNAGVPWTIEPMPAEGPRLEGALSVYREAFSRPPYNDRERVREVRARIASQHRARPGFRSFIAVHADGRVIGMTYGYRSEPGQWWHEAVAAAISPDAYREWMTDSFELAEIAVAPAYQSLGIGRSLIEHLLTGVTERICVLSTQTNSRAYELYERAGFEHIVEMRFMTGGKPFYVMGRRMETHPAAPR